MFSYCMFLENITQDSPGNLTNALCLGVLLCIHEFICFVSVEGLHPQRWAVGAGKQLD